MIFFKCTTSPRNCTLMREFTEDVLWTKTREGRSRSPSWIPKAHQVLSCRDVPCGVSPPSTCSLVKELPTSLTCRSWESVDGPLPPSLWVEQLLAACQASLERICEWKPLLRTCWPRAVLHRTKRLMLCSARWSSISRRGSWTSGIRTLEVISELCKVHKLCLKDYLTIQTITLFNIYF